QAARMSTSSSSAQASASAQAAQGAAKRGAQGAASTAQAPTPSGAQAPAKAAAQTLGTGKAQTGASGSEADALIDFDAFLRVQLRLATVLEAVPVPKSKKLLRLQVDLGENKPRQILAGIGQHYQAADLVGRQVVVVANLKPRKMMGLDSQGMVLAVSDAEGLNVLSPARPFPAGTTVG
ncbi:MAG: methionine--tRNA ligase subunit beta, partial [Polyangiales bacterium]